MSDQKSTIDTEQGTTDRSGSAQRSWDPYEVWRTRVLLPRLEDERSAPTEQPETTSEPAPRLDPASAVS